MEFFLLIDELCFASYCKLLMTMYKTSKCKLESKEFLKSKLTSFGNKM